MKNNIDEDINYLKRLNLIIEKTKAYDDCIFPIGTRGEFGSLYISDLKKALSELETYKKIAEYLAVYGRETCPDCNSCENKVVLGYENGYCKKFNNATECIIDWARKEVEKDV